MIVVDTNVIAYLHIPGEHTKQVEKLFTYDDEWVVPTLWRSELRNILARYLRLKVLTLENALYIMQKADQHLSYNEHILRSSTVLKLTQDSGCSAYDCEFVALAHILSVPLLTFDKKLLAKFRKTAISPKQYLLSTNLV